MRARASSFSDEATCYAFLFFTASFASALFLGPSGVSEYKASSSFGSVIPFFTIKFNKEYFVQPD